MIPLTRLLLLARCAVAAAFAWYLWSEAPASPEPFLRAFALFALADGILALIVALLAFIGQVYGAIAVVTTVSGVIRVAAGLAIWWGPGIPMFGLTLVLYLGVLAALFALFGIIEVIEAVRLRRRTGPNPLSIVFAIDGIGTAALGVAMFFIDPGLTSTRRLLLGVVLLEAIALFVLTLGVGLRKRPTIPAADDRLSGPAASERTGHE